jgi:ABC-type branched-subunit amino acid transport system ATPase component
MLEVRDLVSGYGEIDVLRRLSATFEPRRITTVIGANGAGKSTFLKTVFGMVQARRGSVHFDGTDITSWASKKVLGAGIAYVPQGRCNFPAMTVQDNLLVSLDHRPKSGDTRASLESMYAEFPMLAEKRSTLAGNLSGGQQQILEMAMALLQEPRLLLIDEPSLGLSPAMLDRVFARIVSIASGRAVTVVMVEQNAKQALSISDRGVVLELGQLRMEGASADLLAHPGIRELYLGG